MLSLSRLPWMNLRGYPVRTGTLMVFSMLMTMTIFGGTLVVQGIEHGLRTTQSRLGADIMVTPDEGDTDFDAQTFLVNARGSRRRRWGRSRLLPAVPRLGEGELLLGPLSGDRLRPGH